MAFTGKATYSAGATRPEIAEDVADLVSLNAPFETPLLEALGDASREARSTVHEWLEDSLLPNTDKVSDTSISNPLTETTFDVANAARFRVGDQIKIEGSAEVMLVTAVGSTTITVVRGYGGTTAENLVNNSVIRILGNAGLEGDDAAAARFTARTRKTNFTQIFAATVEVSGSELAVRQLGVGHELNYQKQQRLRELLRDLENCVINGVAPAANPEGSASVRRTMRGIIPSLTTNAFKPGVAGFPADSVLTDLNINAALRAVWKNGNAQADLLVVGAGQKRNLNNLLLPVRQAGLGEETYRNIVSVFESDFGVCQVVLSRWMPPGTVLFLDSSRLEVLPLAGRSFHYRPLAATGDRESGQVIGEYTLELRNENAHAMISGLTDG
jgi:hypothetical protein